MEGLPDTSDRDHTTAKWWSRCVILSVVVSLCIQTTYVRAADCAPQQLSSTVVRKVIDGDTLIVDKGLKFRIIGVNTLELQAPGFRERYWARQAKRRLAALLKPGTTVHFHHDAERQDRYHRTLVHLFLPNGQNVTQLLLQEGLGIFQVIPPNLAYLDCYNSAERIARGQRNGVWSMPMFEQNILASKVKISKGFQVVKSKLLSFRRSARSIWLELSGGLVLRIDKQDWQYFRGYSMREWVDQEVVVRGWVYTHARQKVMRIRHPIVVERLR